MADHICFLKFTVVPNLISVLHAIQNFVHDGYNQILRDWLYIFYGFLINPKDRVDYINQSFGEDMD